MRKKITGKEAVLALLNGETVWAGPSSSRVAYRYASYHGKVLGGGVTFTLDDVLDWNEADCEIEVPSDPATASDKPKCICPVCGAAIAEFKLETVSGVGIIGTGRGAFPERIGPNELIAAMHCDSCGAAIETRAAYWPKPELPKLPEGLAWEGGGIRDSRNGWFFPSPKTKQERDRWERMGNAYAALVELWDRQNGARPQ